MIAQLELLFAWVFCFLVLFCFIYFFACFQKSGTNKNHGLIHGNFCFLMVVAFSCLYNSKHCFWGVQRAGKTLKSALLCHQKTPKCRIYFCWEINSYFMCRSSMSPFPFPPFEPSPAPFLSLFFPCVFCSFFSVFHCSPGCQRGSGCLSPWPWGTKQLHGTRSPARTLPSAPKASAAPSFQKSLWELRGPALGKAGVCRAQIPSSASGWGLGKTGLLLCCASLCFIGNKTQPVPEDYSQFE